MRMRESERLWEKAKQLMPGGVNSPVRSFRSVGGAPLFMARGEGPYLWDVDGNRYVDFVLSWGPLALGHAHPAVVDAVTAAARGGTSFGANTVGETELADLLVQALPSVDLVRLVNSGTEATMSAARLARAYTSRDKVVKFAGGYHGHADMYLVKAGSGASTLGLPDSPGVPQAMAADTLTAPFNDLPALRSLFAARPDDIAAVIVEPIMANMGFIAPEDGFLDGLQSLCREYGALLIFDEVITGFRVGLYGAQGLWGIEPDLTCLGKVIGGGLPVGAYGGRAAVMEMVAPSGPVYQAGTLAGNPLATAAGTATIRALMEPGVFPAASARARRLADGIAAIAQERGVALQVGCEGTVFGLFFLNEPGARIVDGESARRYADTERWARFFHLMLEQGFYFAPSQFEVAFLSVAHDDEIVAATLEAVERAFSDPALRMRSAG